MNPFADALRLALSAALAASKEARHFTERQAGKAIAVETREHRFVIRFDAGEAHVEAGDGEADATVRGSPTAVLGTLLKDGGETAAVFGDAELFEDFRRSFRPHLPPTLANFAEDAGDAVRVGAQAAQSALQGVAGAMRSKAKDYFPDQSEQAEREAAMAAEIEALKGRIDALEERVRVLEGETVEAGAPEQSAAQGSETQ